MDKKNNLLETFNKTDLLDSQRKESPTPINIFTQNDTMEEIKREKTKFNKNYSSSKSTTARINYNNLNRVNALITMGLAESFNDLLENMLDNFEHTLSKEEKSMQKTIITMYENKGKR